MHTKTLTQDGKQNNNHAYFLTFDDFCPFDWVVNQPQLDGHKTTIGGWGRGGVRGGGGTKDMIVVPEEGFHMQEMGMMFGNLELNNKRRLIW